MSNFDPQTPNSRYTNSNDGAASESTTEDRAIAAAAALNEQSARQNCGISVNVGAEPQTPYTAAIFRSNTIAPSPPPPQIPHSLGKNTSLAPLDISDRPAPLDLLQSSPLSSLRIQTDVPSYTVTAASAQNTARSSTDSSRLPAKATNIPLGRTPSIKNVFATSVGSQSNFGSAPNSALSSPMLNAMADVTPLPSPLLSGDSPGPWKKLTSHSRPASRDMMLPMTADSALVTTNGESVSAAIANQHKRRAYHGILTHTNESALSSVQISKEKSAEGHARNRSMSEYVPEPMQVPRRNVTVSGTHAPNLDATPDSMDVHTMRREPHLAVQRGLAPIPRPPTPPSSRTGGESSDSDSSLSQARQIRAHRKRHYEYFEAFTREDSKRRRWRGLKLLGEGTFSRVILATSQVPEEDRIDENVVFGHQMEGLTPLPETKIDRKKLVAIKICEHGPKGGASEERVEMSLKRELEIMKSISHPSLVHLKAWNIEDTRAILVLSYCPGGDLFEVASEHRDLLVPGLLRRMFAELVAAVQYLHDRHIVHRDIKLENVLFNLPLSELSRLSLTQTTNWSTYPNALITLTDLGLSRRVADDEKLTTRCGSDDYAAPEVIMGQPYDGRATDAWSLGVLLYALLESRLPFDPNPAMSEGQKLRSRTSHRIARVEWCWIEYAGEEGDHEGDPQKFREKGLEGAMLVTEGLLKRARSRWSLEKVAETEWVRGGIEVEGGIRFREEDVPDEVVGL